MSSIEILSPDQTTMEASTKLIPDGIYKHAAIATDSPICSVIGRDVLRRGGSVVDAALTSALCLGVVNPQSSGLGGGFIMTVYIKENGKAESLNARERSPAGLEKSFIPPDDETEEAVVFSGPKLICLPTEIAGMWAAHQRYGKLPWQELFTPAIKLAEDGYPMTHHTEFSLRFREERGQAVDPKIIARYTNADGTMKTQGSWITFPEIAKTLRKIASEGPDVFYHGEIPKMLAQEVQSQGGVLAAEDFATYKPIWTPAERTSLRGEVTVLTPPLPSSGPTLQLILRVMSECGMGPADFDNFESKLRIYNRFIEVERLAMGLRRNLGDVDTNELKNILATIYSKDFANMVAKRLVVMEVESLEKTEHQEWKTILQNGEEGCTTQISIIAENGDAISMTSTIGKYFFNVGLIIRLNPDLLTIFGKIVVTLSPIYPIAISPGESWTVGQENAPKLGASYSLRSTEAAILTCDNVISMGFLPRARFGSAMQSESTGLVFNSHVKDFRRGTINNVRPNKLPLSAICGSISIQDDSGDVVLVTGGAGARRIVSANAWIILRTLLCGVKITDAVAERRIYTNARNVVMAEEGFPKELVDVLRQSGHNIDYEFYGRSIVNAVQRLPSGKLLPVADMRKGKLSTGY